MTWWLGSLKWFYFEEKTSDKSIKTNQLMTAWHRGSAYSRNCSAIKKSTRWKPSTHGLTALSPNNHSTSIRWDDEKHWSFRKLVSYKHHDVSLPKWGRKKQPFQITDARRCAENFQAQTIILGEEIQRHPIHLQTQVFPKKSMASVRSIWQTLMFDLSKQNLHEGFDDI